MFTAIIPWPWRACALGLLLAAAGAVGWLDGASHVHKQWDAARTAAAQAITQQTAHVARVETQQSIVNQEVGNAVQDRITAVHQYYAGRVRGRPAIRPGAVPTAPDPAGRADAAFADDGAATADPDADPSLAERCAVTTAIAQGWAEWWREVEGVQ